MTQAIIVRKALQLTLVIALVMLLIGLAVLDMKLRPAAVTPGSQPTYPSTPGATPSSTLTTLPGTESSSQHHVQSGETLFPTPVPGVFALQYYPPLVLDYDPGVWTDKSEPGNPSRYVNYLQARDLETCQIGVKLPSGWDNYPHETAQLGKVKYTVYTFEGSSTQLTTAFYFADTLNGYDYSVGIPIPTIQAKPAEWGRCKALAEPVLATLHAAPPTGEPAEGYRVGCYLTPSAGLTPIAGPDPHAGWKRYSNAEYGFSIDLPPDWVVYACDHHLDIQPGIDDPLTLNIG